MFRILLLLPFFLLASNYKYEVSIATIFNNEARFLKEWIEFHKTLGVEHFYLYNNGSDDNFAEVLRPYVESGDVDLIDWSRPSKNVHDFNEIQCAAYMDALKRAKGVSHWLAVIDSDEFIFTTDKTSLPQFLRAYKKYGGVGINWQMYGTSNVQRVPDNAFMIELLVRKGETTHGENIHVKTIVQPKRVDRIHNPHFARYKDGYYAVSPSKKVIPDWHNDDIDVSRIRINHYWSRDIDFVVEYKVVRQLKWWGSDPNLIWERLLLYDKVEDKAIFFWLGEMKKRLGR